MMPKPTTAADDTPIRVVIVTLDRHIAGAVAQARARLAPELPGLHLSVHAATNFNDSAALKACRADVAAADIVFANMLFIDEHIREVLPALQARRDQCDAMVCAMSAGEVMRLTRMGGFRMDGTSKGPMALLRKLRGKSTTGGSKDGGAGQMAALRLLPKLLRFFPGKAQDIRAYLLALSYWLSGSAENIADLVRMLVSTYADGPRRVLRGRLSAGAPREYPDVGLYHPALKNPLTEKLSDLPAAPRPAVGTVGVLLMRSYVLAGDARHYDRVIAALEARGLRVIPAFASGLDSRPAMEKFFMEGGCPTVDAVLSLTGFSLVGGPAFHDAKAAEDMLARLDIPYVAAQPLEFQSVEQWGASPQGLTPLESTIMVAIPELDGATGPTVFGGRSAGAMMEGIPERVEALASRVLRLVKLRRSSVAQRRVAVVLFNFPPNAGAAGTAAYLSVFQSLFNTLHAMKDHGYTVDLPNSVEALRDAVLGGNAERYGTDANVMATVSVDDHVRHQPHLADIERQWGLAPGRHQANGSSIFVLGARFGNVMVGLQPALGFEGDPMRLLFESGFAPTHAFAAFYTYVRQTFGADALLHFGTHGALEFMPGKQVGLSSACWPERLLGDVPNVYLYAANNPSEGALARRRAAATLVSYLTPPVAQAGLYKGLSSLRETLDQLRATAPTDPTLPRLLEQLQAQARTLDLCTDDAPAWTSVDDPAVSHLRNALTELEQTLIPFGLHVVGEAMPVGARQQYLEAVATQHWPADQAARVAQHVVAGADALSALRQGGVPDTPEARSAVDGLRRMAGLLAEDHELPALMRALDGRFIRPAPGGDLLRNPEVLPTGRNVHGFDPFSIPSAFALTDGARQAQKLLDRHQAEGHPLPRAVAMVLWGADNLKSGGGPIGQALAMMGARPRLDSYGRLCGAELIPLSELGRPRVDVLITLSGIFRDLLPMQTRLLAEAAFLAASADEPLESNPIREHALAHAQATGTDLETAALRVFSNGDGAYGANVNQLVDAGTWVEDDELSETFCRRKGFAYGRNGQPQSQPALLNSLLSKVELAYQNLESVELGVTTVDHYFDTLGGIGCAARRGRKDAVLPVYIGDQTLGEGRVRTLVEQVSLETRTRSLNPRWAEEMLRHGAEGVRYIEAQVTNTLGWSATTTHVEPWVYRQLTETYVLDPQMRERLAQLNPKASVRLTNRLLEATERHYWQPDPQMLNALRQASDELEDRLEGIAQKPAA